MHKQEQKKTVVWGLGKTGRSLCHYFLQHKLPFLLVDQRELKLEEWGAETLQHLAFVLQRDCDLALLKAHEVETILLSPGVPFDLPLLEEARKSGIQTISDIQWVWHQTSQWKVAVTGSTGKSTTVSMIGDMLGRHGWNTFVGGNWGVPFVDCLDAQPPFEKIVLECSSFQLEACPFLTPDIAILMNLQPNHLNRHETMEKYAQCKKNLFVNASESSWFLFESENELAHQWCKETKAKPFEISLEKELSIGAFARGSSAIIRFPENELEIDWSDFPLLGAHNRKNLLFALSASLLSGVNPEACNQSIRNFVGLEHRLEKVQTTLPWLVINDSKSTTVSSTISAIQSIVADFPASSLVCLVGGESKGESYEALNKVLLENKQVEVLLFGSARHEIQEGLSSFSCAMGETLQEAFELAVARRKSNGILLLSPACSSYDQFQNFEERGKFYKRLVKELEIPKSKS